MWYGPMVERCVQGENRATDLFSLSYWRRGIKEEKKNFFSALKEVRDVEN